MTSTPAGSSPATGNTQPSQTSGTAAPSPTVIQTAAGITGTTTVLTIHSHIRLVRLLTPLSGRHYLAIRVSSNARTVLVHLLLARHGQRAKWVTYRVRANRLVKIAVPSSVIKVKEVVLG